MLPKRIRPNGLRRSAKYSSRDLNVLFDLYWSRAALTTTQIRRLRFPSVRTAQRTLRRLLNAGDVKAHLQGGALHQDNVFSITRKGADMLHAESGVDACPTRMPRAQRLQHTLAVRDAGIAAVLVAREGIIPLAEVRFEEDLAGEAAFRDAHLLPDATFGFDAGSGVIFWIGVEVCLETEGESVLRKKIAAWRGVFSRHSDLVGLLVVAQTERRVNLFRRLCRELGVPVMVVLSRDLESALRSTEFHELYARTVRAERIVSSGQVLETASVSVHDVAAFIPL
jgi:hypothetical protein